LSFLSFSSSFFNLPLSLPLPFSLSLSLSVSHFLSRSFAFFQGDHADAKVRWQAAQAAQSKL
jgi:hypothetical protein